MRDSTDEPADLKAFLAAHRDYVVNVLVPTEQELRAVLREWRKPGYWGRYLTENADRLPDPSPIQRVRVRVKRPESVVDKIQRRPDDFPDGLTETSFQIMNDALGGRVIVYFLSQLPLVDKEIRDNEFLEVSERHAPIAYMSSDLANLLGLRDLRQSDKESGYQGLHYYVRLRKSEVSPRDRPWIEIQVRTLVQDAWAEVEHILGYKPNKRTTFAVRKQFEIISNHLGAVDAHFNFLHEELTRLQIEKVFSSSDLLNAENLPSILSDVGYRAAQQEIDGMLKVLSSGRIRTVGELQNLLTPKNLELIANAHWGQVSRAPKPFDIVAALPYIKGKKTDNQKIESVKTQLQVFETHRELRTVSEEARVPEPKVPDEADGLGTADEDTPDAR